VERVVVVGAGLAGASVAWHLSRTHAVTLLEAGEQPGAEASAQNAGMQRRLAHDSVERCLAIRSGHWLDDLPADFREAPPARRVGGIIALAGDPTTLDAGVAHLRDAGIAVHDVGDAPPPALRGSPLTRTWHVPDEALLDAHALVTGFLRGLRARGGTVLTRAPALALELGPVVRIRTPHGVIEADQVVLAAGAWSAELADRLGLHRPVTVLQRHLLAAHSHPVSAPEHPYCWIDDRDVYARPEAGGWLVSPCDETEVAPVAGAGPIDPVYRAWALDKLERHLPALADIHFTGGWTGLRTFAGDRRPVLGPDPEVPGLHWATALGGFGVTCAFAAGELVADLIRGTAPDWIDVPAVAPGRTLPFDRLPRAPGLAL